INSKTPNIEYLENTEIIGRVLFQNYLIVFELAALMLLVAMVCAIILAHKQMDKSLNLEEENL
ncbi:MAG: NADH-quinone oxidoreductase subunit J, partial [Campylobacter sp.]|nr:NADH-quinone oxidoreductase subunit J [Campylobacter sp.]